MIPKPNLACPVCGGPNGCEPARLGTFDTPCWCAELVLPSRADEGDNASCLCMRCATAQAAKE